VVLFLIPRVTSTAVHFLHPHQTDGVEVFFCIEYTLVQIICRWSQFMWGKLKFYGVMHLPRIFVPN